MTAYNVVRFKVKPGKEKEFEDVHRGPLPSGMAGFRKFSLIKTGNSTYCFVGDWNGDQDIVNARPAMISMLDKARPLLEDLGGGLGVTDPVSGESVVEIRA